MRALVVMVLLSGGCIVMAEQPAPRDGPAHFACDLPEVEPGHDWPSPAMTMAVWPEPPTGACLHQAAEIRWVWTDEGTVQDACEGGVACFHSADTCRRPTIVLGHRATNRTRAHELSHWIFECQGLGSSDENHDDPLFKDTIEGILAVSELLEGGAP